MDIKVAGRLLRKGNYIMINQLRKKLQEKDSIVATRIDFTWPQLIEIIGGNDIYDYIEFLAEYAPFDQYDLENMARAAELHGVSMIIKPDYHNRIYVAQKAIASGFEGILFTDHTSADEIRETIRQITPATPDGGALGFVNRRWIRNANLSSQMEYARDVRDIVKGFMIEKVEAVHNLEEICKVDEVYFLQFGPADFSMNSGFDKSEHLDEVKEVERYVIETALRYGKRVRVEIRNASDAAYYRDLGVRDFALGTDLRILKDFYKQEGERLKDTVQS